MTTTATHHQSTGFMGDRASRRHLTKEMCTPNPRCLPLHSRHMKVPYETVAHCGFLPLQSTQTCIAISAEPDWTRLGNNCSDGAEPP